mmetsp:Transcript_22137/g.62857  ORF Transcript_22137/g.62857 Transcript_22137/m.62857 type:complete len:344 (+) Transcript_22137:3-1034(+)
MHLQVPAWSPPADGKVDTEEDDGDKVDLAAIEAMKGELYGVDPKSLLPCQVHDFEKDDDTNFHIDFLTTSTNSRAANYDIKASERAHVKVTAGRIIPALATTTAMICGLVDLEFLKLVKALHKGEEPLEKFFNANVNLATGSLAMNVFRPEPAAKRPTKLGKMPEFTSWDKVDIEGEISLKALVEHLQTQYGATVKRLIPAGDDKICVFDSKQIEKLNWKIEMKEGKAVVEPEAVYGEWPQLRMAMEQLSKVGEGAARRQFESQINTAARSLQSVKDTFTSRFDGPASEAYTAVARPPDEEAEKQKYFDAVQRKRKYVALQAHVVNDEGADAELPLIRYTFRK